jgi:peptide/nickel transport system permease protein
MMMRLARAGTREVMLRTREVRPRPGSPSARSCCATCCGTDPIPIVTVFGLEFGSTIAFAVVTETIFAWPGIGKLIIDSIHVLDRPVMVAYLMLVVFMFIIINFLVDIAYSALDPRLRCRSEG